MNTHSKCVSASTLFALAGTLFLVGCHTESSEYRHSDAYSMNREANTSTPTYNSNGNVYDEPNRPTRNDPGSNVTRTPDEVMGDRQYQNYPGSRSQVGRSDDVYTRDVQSGSHSPSATTSSTSSTTSASNRNPPEAYVVDRSRESDRTNEYRSRYENRDGRYRDNSWYDQRDMSYYRGSGGMAGATDFQLSNAITPPDNAYPMKGAYPRNIDWHFNGPSANRGYTYDTSRDSYYDRDMRAGRDWDRGYRSDYRRGNEYDISDQEGTTRTDRGYTNRYSNTDREYVPDRMDRDYVNRRASSQNPNDTTPTPPDNNYDNSAVRGSETRTATSTRTRDEDNRFYPVTREGAAPNTTGATSTASSTGWSTSPGPSTQNRTNDSTLTQNVKDQTTIGDHKSMASGMTVDQLTNDWPQEQKDAIKTLTAKYGQPAEATQSVVCWKNTGPFLYTKVMKDSVAHDFPKHHNDFLEQGIAYKVPADKAADLLAFDGSLIIDRTRGVMAARCDKEENNLLALNLANDIIAGSKSVEEARNTLAQIATASTSDTNNYMKKLSFQSQTMAADPDRAIDVRASTEGK